MVDVPALILAGGLGTRLRGVVPGIPKVLAPVRGRPFLSYLLDQLQAAGVREVVLCTGHRADQVFETFGTRYASSRSAVLVRISAAGHGRRDPPGDRPGRGRAVAGAQWRFLYPQPARRILPLAPGRESSFPGSLLLDLDRELGSLRDGRARAPGERSGRFRRSAELSRGRLDQRRGLFATAIPDRVDTAGPGHLAGERDVSSAGSRSGWGATPPGARFIDIGTPESYAAGRDHDGRDRGGCGND